MKLSATAIEQKCLTLTQRKAGNLIEKLIFFPLIVQRSWLRPFGNTKQSYVDIKAATL